MGGGRIYTIVDIYCVFTIYILRTRIVLTLNLVQNHYFQLFVPYDFYLTLIKTKNHMDLFRHILK